MDYRNMFRPDLDLKNGIWHIQSCSIRLNRWRCALDSKAVFLEDADFSLRSLAD